MSTCRQWLVLGGNGAESDLEGESCAEQEYEHELEVLINGPQRFDSSLSILNKELEGSWRQNLIGKQQPGNIESG